MGGEYQTIGSMEVRGEMRQEKERERKGQEVEGWRLEKKRQKVERSRRERERGDRVTFSNRPCPLSPTTRPLFTPYFLPNSLLTQFNLLVTHFSPN
jgi:hypothetical protein